MRIIMFVHSLISDWNHGNAHFLRGIATELVHRGHDVRIYEPLSGWSMTKLLQYHGEAPVRAFHEYFPDLNVSRYDTATLDLDRDLDGADLVLVHEWNEHKLVKRLGQHRKQNDTYRLLFHDTHHRSVTDPHSMAAYDLTWYDGVLAFGDAIRDIYLEKALIQRAWTWHEAADIRIFRPIESLEKLGDLVWIGNWGDEERSAELQEYLFDPVRELSIRCKAYGVRYPVKAHRILSEAGIEYAGWLPNYRVPQIFSRFTFTIHIPRRPYVEMLPGIPTIRPFEALACGIPLICSKWNDTGHLFTPEKDYLVAANGREMVEHMRALVHDPVLAKSLAAHGRETILASHTCAHRVDELFTICRSVGVRSVPECKIESTIRSSV